LPSLRRPYLRTAATPPTTMFRTAILRSAAAATRTAMRPVPSAAARRAAVVALPRTAPSFVPKPLAWQAVRCYASGSGLDRTEVYERIKQLLSGFDKVGRVSAVFLFITLHQPRPRMLSGCSSLSTRHALPDSVRGSPCNEANALASPGQRPCQRESPATFSHHESSPRPVLVRV
jgi:hypothetical protein